MASTLPTRPVSNREDAHRKISAAGWGLLFIWVGVAVLAQVGWGYGLIGVGVIILGSQAVHLTVGDSRLDWFSTVCGLVFLLGGIWELFSIQVGLIPILIIGAGVALLLSALTSRPAH